MKKNILFCLFFLIGISGQYINSRDNRLIDSDGLERVFHGVNVVYKGDPWHPITTGFSYDKSFSTHDAQLLKDWGFNMIRLGVMWPGLEPKKGEYSSDYLNKIEEIINICQKHDIYVLLDFHQDLLALCQVLLW